VYYITSIYLYIIIQSSVKFNIHLTNANHPQYILSSGHI